jgi:adenylate cyclase
MASRSRATDVWKSSFADAGRATSGPQCARTPWALYRPNRRTVRILWIAGAAICVALILLTLIRPKLLQRLELVAYDQLLAAVPERPLSAEVVIVDIDERSLKEHGQWPWPRSQVGRLLDLLLDAGAASVGVDFLFPEPDRLSLLRIRDYMERNLDTTLELDHLPAAFLDLDLALAETVAQPEIVSGIFFAFDPPAVIEPIPVPMPGVALQSDRGAPEAPLPEATRASFPVAALAAATRTVGFVNSLPDIDGTIRRAPLLVRYGDRVFPSLALATVMKARGVDTVLGRVSHAGLEEIRIGDIAVPTDHQGALLLPFAEDSGARFAYHSAADVLAGAVPTEAFADKIVLFGSSAAGLMDLHPTPFDRVFPGVQIHAETAATILEGEYLHRPSWSPAAQVAAVLLVGCAMIPLLSNFRVTVCLVASAILLTLIWLGSRWLLAATGTFVSPVIALATVVALGVVLGSARSRIEEKRALANICELAAAQDCAIVGLVSVAETRDPETGFHILRTQHYVRALAEHIAGHPHLRRLLSPEDAQAIYRSAPLHDIGKVGVPDRILLKPDRLTDDEYEIMKSHTRLGHEVLTRAEETSGLDASSSFLRHAGEIALAHHERWDGSGYPQGLAGDEIPLSARLMAVADVYDAIRSRRHYKPARSHQEARDLIVEASGTQFDPTVVQAFLEVEDTFIEIADRYTDSKPGPIEHR